MEFASQHDWVMQVDLSGAPPTLSPDLEAISFRVVQEALTNVAKHALATHVAVTITQADQGLQVIVRDNGQGFVFSDDLGIASGHVGLRQMRERLNAIQGRLTIHSEVGVGTEVRAWMPFSSHTQGDVHDQAAVAAR
jgi:signal transduction histidine kinase